MNTYQKSILSKKTLEHLEALALREESVGFLTAKFIDPKMKLRQVIFSRICQMWASLQKPGMLAEGNSVTNKTEADCLQNLLRNPRKISGKHAFEFLIYREYLKKVNKFLKFILEVRSLSDKTFNEQIDRLVNCVGPTTENPLYYTRFGICYLLTPTDNLNPFESWNKFSGNLIFPVPAPAEDSKLPRGERFTVAAETGTLWNKNTEYGRLRWELLEYTTCAYVIARTLQIKTRQLDYGVLPRLRRIEKKLQSSKTSNWSEEEVSCVGVFADTVHPFCTYERSLRRSRALERITILVNLCSLEGSAPIFAQLVQIRRLAKENGVDKVFKGLLLSGQLFLARALGEPWECRHTRGAFIPTIDAYIKVLNILLSNTDKVRASKGKHHGV